MTACSPVVPLNWIASFGDYRLVRNVAYEPGERHGLDVYMPDNLSKPAPVIVFYYGGGWTDGDKEMYRFLGAALASRGFVTVIPDYRVYPAVRFPDFLVDAARAFRWAHDHAGTYGGDPKQMVIMGHSAGAHIAAMLAFDPQWLRQVGLDSRTDLKAMIGLSGPYDFLPLHDATLMQIFGPDDQLAKTQPINFVDGKEVPAFLATGRSDDIVDPGTTQRLAERIRQKGGRATVKVYDGVSHKTMIGAFAGPLRSLAPVLDDVTAFVGEIIGAAPASTTASGSMSSIHSTTIRSVSAQERH